MKCPWKLKYINKFLLDFQCDIQSLEQKPQNMEFSNTRLCCEETGHSLQKSI